MKDFFMKMLRDSRGGASHKRLITVVAAGLLFIAFAISIFKKTMLEPYMWETIAWIALGGMGISTTEYFSKASSKPAYTEKAADPLPTKFVPDSETPTK